MDQSTADQDLLKFACELAKALCADTCDAPIDNIDANPTIVDHNTIVLEAQKNCDLPAHPVEGRSYKVCDTYKIVITKTSVWTDDP